MPTIKNTGKVTPLGIASGFTVAPGASLKVPGKVWERVKDKRLVTAWVALGKLVVEGADEAEADERTADEREQDDLIAELANLRYPQDAPHVA